MQTGHLGIVCEIYAGGDSLARGYLHQEALTKEKFIESPF
jgi:non-ribosomal peptide synthetase component F